MKWFKSIFGLNKRPKSDVRDSADTALTPSSEVNKTLTFGSASEALDKLVSDNCSAAEHMLSQSGDPALPTLIADRLIGNLNCSCEKLIRLAGERGDHLSVEPLKTIVRELLSKNSGQYIIRDSMLALYRIQGTEVHGLLMECLKSMDWIWRQHAAFFLCEIEEEYAKKHIKGTYYSQASELRHLIMARGFGAGRQVTNTDPYEAVWQKELSRMSDVLETIPATREYRKYWHVRGPGGDELLDHPPEGTDQQKLNAIMDKIRTAAQTNPVEAQLLRNTAVAFMEHHANSEFSKTNTIDSAPIEPSQQPSASLSA